MGLGFGIKRAGAGGRSQALSAEFMDQAHIIILGDSEQALRRLGNWQRIDHMARVSVHAQRIHRRML